jgi:DNA-binding CsgD family transcriptional regulator
MSWRKRKKERKSIIIQSILLPPRILLSPPSKKDSSSNQEIASDVVIDTTNNLLTQRQPQQRHRSTRIELANTLRKIRYLIGETYTNEEIMTMLGLSEVTFYRYLRKIHEQDKELFKHLDQEALEFEVHTAREQIARVIRNQDEIANDPKQSIYSRQQADIIKMNAIGAMVKLSIEGAKAIPEIRDILKMGNKLKQ